MAAMDVSSETIHPAFDFDSLANRYAGWPLVYRLKHIAARRPALSKRAFFLAMEAVRNTTQDGASYENFARLAGVAPDDWGKQAMKKADAHRTHVEKELQNHMNQAIREQVRRCYVDKARSELERGDIAAAKSSILRAREYIANGRQAADISLCHMDLCCLTKDWPGVRAAALRPELSPGSDALSGNLAAQARIAVAQGYFAIADGKYEEAADRLFSLPAAVASQGLVAYVSSTAGAAGDGLVPLYELGHPEDVAAAALLCALATYDRAKLNALSNNAACKSLLEASPAMREVLHATVSARHSYAMHALTRLRDELELDWALDGPAVETCMALFRRRCIEWHMAPYHSLSLAAMSDTLQLPLDTIRSEVETLITAGNITGRIDAVQQVFKAHRADPRAAAVQALEDAKRALDCEARVLLLKLSLQGFHPSAKGGAAGQTGGTSSGRVGSKSKRSAGGNAGRGAGKRDASAAASAAGEGGVLLPGQVDPHAGGGGGAGGTGGAEDDASLGGDDASMDTASIDGAESERGNVESQPPVQGSSLLGAGPSSQGTQSGAAQPAQRPASSMMVDATDAMPESR